jgi:glycosyltransferase involved in cell wall biosynthesis
MINTDQKPLIGFFPGFFDIGETYPLIKIAKRYQEIGGKVSIFSHGGQYDYLAKEQGFKIFYDGKTLCDNPEYKLFAHFSRLIHQYVQKNDFKNFYNVLPATSESQSIKPDNTSLENLKKIEFYKDIIIILPDDARYHYIPNGVWANEWGNKPVKVPSAHQRIFDWCTHHKKLKIVYTGSHGPPNALDQILALKKTVGRRDVPYHFVLIGDGIQKSELMVQVERQRISFIDILPRVKQDEIPAILNQADVCFLGWQKKPIYDLGISPNKLCDYFLAAKPVLHAYQGSHDPVAAAGAGITVEPFNPRQLDDALRKFCEMTDAQRQFLGANGKKYALAYLEWSVIGENYYRICRHLVSE